MHLLVLLGKVDCELCDQAESLITAQSLSTSLVKIDITQYDTLNQRYAWHIPVLLSLSEIDIASVLASHALTANNINKENGQIDSLVDSAVQKLVANGFTENCTRRNIQLLKNQQGNQLELFWPFTQKQIKDFLSRSRH